MVALTPVRRRFCVAFLLGCIAWHASAWAEIDIAEDLHRERMEKLRKVHANQIHLMATDLLDELVLAYKSAPPFAKPTQIVLADVNGPLGYGSGFEAILENHLAELLIEHPQTGLRLVHCPACHATTTHSDAKATVISKGIDQPDALRALGVKTGSLHAMFIDVEAEGANLVLRARIVALEEGLPVVHARTISSNFLSPALLRSGNFLVSAEKARASYLEAVSKQGPLQFPVRFSISSFASSRDSVFLAPPPIVWLSAGGEFAINHSRDWLGAILVGGTWVPSLYNGYMLQGRLMRLLTGAAASYTHPNLYLTVGASLIGLQGPVTLTLQDEQPNLTVIQQLLNNTTPLFFYPSLQVGLDLRIGQRIGIALLGETTPTLANAPAIGTHLDFLFLQIHAVSAEVSLCF